MPQGRALAYGLIALGAGLALLVLLWLLVNAAGGQLRAGGLVLGLLILFVLGGPPLGAGLYLLSRSGQEEQATATFERQRRVIDADRLLRAELARTFTQQAERLARLSEPSMARLATRVRDLAADLEHPGYDQASWYETITLDQDDQDQIRRYDDLLVEEQRRAEQALRGLEAGRAAAADELEQALDRWERQFRGRQDILLRGRRAPGVSAAEVLRARPPSRGGEALAALKLRDAVSFDGDDYVVEASATYFVSGRTWHIHTLRAEQQERYLYVGPGGVTLAVLEPIAAPAAPGAPSLTTPLGACALAEQGTATAAVEGAVGRGEGVAVDYWRYTCDDARLAWVERWTDDAPRAFAGASASPAAFEVWPSAE